RVRRVPARAVEHGSHHSCVQRPGLLRQPLIEGELDLHLPRLHAHEPRTDALHHALTREALAHSLLELPPHDSLLHALPPRWLVFDMCTGPPRTRRGTDDRTRPARQ